VWLAVSVARLAVSDAPSRFEFALGVIPQRIELCEVAFRQLNTTLRGEQLNSLETGDELVCG
jgi:hypothetical protein